ncbi:YicC/YloC family endoribonuclease [Thermogutta sp.]|uniref:YicC/YloC family endoribonuclease n=1 Tax=Thermogutta sp. TaxID=1962930 RepID=UPI00321FF4C3
MLSSMTGFGEARLQKDDTSFRVEIRAVNNRFLKVLIRCNEGLPAAVESAIENLVRKQIRRGTVQVTLFLDRHPRPGDYRINSQVLLGYYRQVEAAALNAGLTPPSGIEPFLMLPGIVSELVDPSAYVAEILPSLLTVVTEALEQLQAMRIREGHAMAADMRATCLRIYSLSEEVEQRAPLVVENYRQRLQERMARLLGEAAGVLKAEDILKEAGLFAERADISEEIVRLRSHIQQFLSVLEEPGDETPGRRLEFLTQEMFREINTMGAKANDAEISRCVVDMKTQVERLREMVQNVE